MIPTTKMVVVGAKPTPTFLETLQANQVVNYDMQDTGTSLTDYSGNSITGTSTGSNVTIDGRNYKRHNGSSEETYVTLPTVGTNFIIGGVFKPHLTNERRILSSQSNSCEMMPMTNSKKLYVYPGSGCWCLLADYALTVDEKIMIFLDCNTSSRRLFINGEKKGTVNSGCTLAGLTKIYNLADSNEYSSGDIGWFIVLNTSLTDEQHAVLYNEEKSKYGLS